MIRIGKFLGATALIAVGAVGHANATYSSSLTFSGNPSVADSLSDAVVINFGTEAQSGGTSPLLGTVVVPLVFYGYATFGLSSVGVGLGNLGSVTGVSALTPFTISWIAASGDHFTFSASSGNFTRNFNSGSYTLSIYLDGQIVDAQNAALDQSALFVDNFSQAGTLGLLSESGVMSTPDPNALPEPVSMGIVGLGLAGIAAVRRRRAKV